MSAVSKGDEEKTETERRGVFLYLFPFLSSVLTSRGCSALGITPITVCPPACTESATAPIRPLLPPVEELKAKGQG